MKSEALVSVIMPCYNQARYMPDAVNSLIAQKHSHWECILVNDGSTDETREVGRRLAEVDARVRYVEQENRGLAGARNRGLDEARGDFIQFLDADDLLFPEKLSSQLALILEAERPAVAYCRPFFCLGDETDREISSARPFPLLDADKPVLDLALRWEKELSIPCHTFLFDARLFRDRHVRFDESLPNHEDWECWMRVFAQRPQVFFVDSKMAVYRRHEVSMCRDEALMRRGWIQALRQQVALNADNLELRWILTDRIHFLEHTDKPEPPVELPLSPLVSVILTSYNYAQFVGDAIRSVLSQSYQHLELIVVDDGSKDDSREVIEETLREARIPVKTVFKENGGQASAFNAGYAEATGHVVAFLDSDDYWYEDRVAKVLDYMRLHPGGGIYQHQMDTGKGLKRHGLLSADVFRLWKQWGNGSFNLADDHSGVFFSPFLPTSGLSFRRSVLDKVFPIPESLVTCPDAFLTRTASAYGPLVSISTCLGVWRDHDTNAGKGSQTTLSNYWIPVILPALNQYYRAHKLGLELLHDPRDRSPSPAARILGEGDGGPSSSGRPRTPKPAPAPATAQPQAVAPPRTPPAPFRRRIISMKTGHRIANTLRAVLPEHTVQRLRTYFRKHVSLL